MSRLPSIDGLRALSISLVLLAHLAGSQHFLPQEAIEALGDIGNLGVRIFFVISGFLITDLLLRELKQTNTISLKKFYIRRTLRIFPASLVFLGCVYFGWRVGWISLQSGDLLHAVTYTANYHLTDAWATRHLWSLSVEEQFYLLWPTILVLAKPRKAIWVLGCVIVAAPIGRVALYSFAPTYRPYIGTSFETVCDALATGCLLSLARPILDRIPSYLLLLRHFAFPALIVAVVLANKLTNHPKVYFMLAIPLMNIIIAMALDRYVRFPQLLAGRLLNTRPMVAIGVLSYSLYLWQQPFLIQGRKPESILTVFPLSLVVCIAVAMLSHFVVELPFLQLKRRFQS